MVKAPNFMTAWESYKPVTFQCLAQAWINSVLGIFWKTCWEIKFKDLRQQWLTLVLHYSLLVTWIRCVQSIKRWKIPIYFVFSSLHLYLRWYLPASGWLNTPDPGSSAGIISKCAELWLSKTNLGWSLMISGSIVATSSGRSWKSRNQQDVSCLCLVGWSFAIFVPYQLVPWLFM